MKFSLTDCCDILETIGLTIGMPISYAYQIPRPFLLADIALSHTRAILLAGRSFPDHMLILALPWTPIIFQHAHADRYCRRSMPFDGTELHLVIGLAGA